MSSLGQEAEQIIAAAKARPKAFSLEAAFPGDRGEAAQQPGVDIHALRLWTHVLDAGLARAEA